ncbi:MAG TPA: hypothetical protein VIF62_13290 [Labilithrix sp.]
MDRLKAWLASRAFGVHAALLSSLLACVSLGNGIVADDLWHYANLTRAPGFEPFFHPWPRLFSFFPDEKTARWFIDEGFGPWWLELDVHAVLFRPLASATHAIDYALFPHTPWLMHAHSIAWAAVLVVVASWTHRRLLGATWPAGVATLLYALDPGHGLPIGWLANRNAILSAVFGIAALGALDVSATRRRPAWSLASAALLALALASGESGVCAGALLVAYALTLDDREPRARALSLAPHAVVTIAWVLAYKLGGYGVAGSGMYVEPLREPVLFARAVIVHLPLLLGGELGGVPGELYVATDGATAATVLVIGILATTWAAIAGWRLVRADRRARFFALGSLLATLPVCATFPSARLMVIPGFALFGFVAMIAEHSTSRVARAFRAWSCVARLVLSVPLFAGACLMMRAFGAQVDRLAADMPAAGAASRVMIVNAPDAIFVAFVLARSRLADPPARWRMLSLAAGRRDVHLRRADDHTLIVHTDGGLYRTFTELLGRRPGVAMPAGTRIELTGVSIEVTHAMADGVPDEMTFRYDVPLDDPSLAWRVWRGVDLLPFTPPPAGETTTIPGAIPTPF